MSDAVLQKPIVLIIGSGRSGTTFLAKLLDASPLVLYRHEPDFTVMDPDLPFVPEVGDYPALRDRARRFLVRLLQQNDPKTAATRPVFRKSFRSAGAHLATKGAVYCSKALSRLRLTMPVPDFADRAEPSCFVIKSVNSVCRAGLFADAVPSLKVLHIVRHPAAVVASLQRGQSLGKMRRRIFLEKLFSMPETADFPLSREEVEAASFEEQMVFQWGVFNQKIFGELHDSPNYKIISYEDLCLNIRERVENICRFSGIPFDAQMENFVREVSESEESDASYFSVRRNVRSALYKWKSSLPDEKVSQIEIMARLSPMGRLCLERSAADSAAAEESALPGL